MRKIMTVNVKSDRYDYGYDITVQTGYVEDGEFILEECNHAGATEEMLDYGYASYELCDWVDDERLTLVCDKDNCEYQELIESEPDYDD